jgi:hypothetical protein
MSYQREFDAIELLVSSQLETRGVDAFALCIIKMERQLRRLFTFSVFQYSCFTYSSVPDMKAALAEERGIYFAGFIKGFEAIHPVTVAYLIGADYAQLQSVLPVVTSHRNKIFHGQLTGQELSREDLLGYVASIRDWCRLLGDGARRYMGYEGFDDSFQKAGDNAFISHYKITLSSIDDYRALLKNTLAR